MTAAWVMILNHIEEAKADLKEWDPTIKIPSWVEGAIYGTVLIFWSFAFVQIIFQALPPGYYCKRALTRISPFHDTGKQSTIHNMAGGSEVCYCILSLGSKMYLGLFLLVNVIVYDGNAEEALSGMGFSS